jgi:hypothetical protein
MRSFALGLVLLLPCAAVAASTSNPAPPAAPAVHGVVADPTRRCTSFCPSPALHQRARERGQRRRPDRADENRDSSVMTSSDLKALPIFDNDYATAMSAFLDQNVSDTGGTGLMVDGVEANRATVSASAVQEIRINQDPYSAQYYYPGRGQMEIITKSAADHYHGQFNFLFATRP